MKYVGKGLVAKKIENLNAEKEHNSREVHNRSSNRPIVPHYVFVLLFFKYFYYPEGWFFYSMYVSVFIKTAKKIDRSERNSDT